MAGPGPRPELRFPLDLFGASSEVAKPEPPQVTEPEWRCPQIGCTAPLEAHPVALAERHLARWHAEGLPPPLDP